MADTVFIQSLLRAARSGCRILRILLCAGALLAGGTVQAEQIRDIADFAGIRPNSLVGYGLVVGLDGSGDQTTQSPFTEQGLTNMLSQLGVTLPADANMQMRNIAAVIVTANLPALSRPGLQIDVVVSSIGNARSLRGGTLLMTPMKALTARFMPWHKATCWSAVRAPRPTAAACKSINWPEDASAGAPLSSVRFHCT